VVEAAETAGETEKPVVTAPTPGLDLFLDVRAVTAASSERVARALEAALAAVKGAASTAPRAVGLAPTETAGQA
jgi:hypothetical protein